MNGTVLTIFVRVDRSFCHDCAIKARNHRRVFEWGRGERKERERRERVERESPTQQLGPHSLERISSDILLFLVDQQYETHPRCTSRTQWYNACNNRRRRKLTFATKATRIFFVSSNPFLFLHIHRVVNKKPGDGTKVTCEQ